MTASVVSFVARVTFSGMIAFGTSPNDEMMALVVNGTDPGGGYHMILKHYPSLEFDCDSFLGISRAALGGDGSWTLGDNLPVPCDFFPVSKTPPLRYIDLSAGYDVEFYANGALLSDGLQELDCEVDPTHCECPHGVGELCSFNSELPMGKVQDEARQLKHDFFASKLSADSKSLIISRIMMRSGRIGTNLKDATDWMFSVSLGAGAWRPFPFSVPSNARLDLDIPKSTTASPPTLSVLLKRYSGDVMALNFVQNTNPVILNFANDPHLTEFCLDPGRGAASHFQSFMALADRPLTSLVTLARPVHNPEEECSDLTVRPNGATSGKYPVVCLSPVMQGEQLPKP